MRRRYFPTARARPARRLASLRLCLRVCCAVTRLSFSGQLSLLGGLFRHLRARSDGVWEGVI